MEMGNLRNSSPLDVVDSLGLEIKSRSQTHIQAMCPIHGDKNSASLSIDLKPDGKILVKCFGACDKGWTLYQFVQELKTIPYTKHISNTSLRQSLKENTRNALADLSSFNKLPVALDNKYLLNRGLTNKTIKYWDLRYSGGSIVIPAYSESGKRKLGLIHRLLFANDFLPRYLYTKDFSRNYLFGLNKFEPMNKMVIIVEGPMDAIMMHQNGFKNTVATLGTSVTAWQIRKIKSLKVDSIFLLFDNDKVNLICPSCKKEGTQINFAEAFCYRCKRIYSISAGKEATKKTSERLAGFDVIIPNYEFYIHKDPGEASKEEIQDILKYGVPYLETKLLSMESDYIF